jgi:predicted MFS family arabinose efflux permease
VNPLLPASANSAGLINRIALWLGAPLGPILLLGALNMADEFDRIAFSTLSPEIRDHFEIGDAEILLLSVVPGVIILLTAGLIGWLSDRFSRITVSIVSAIAWGSASILTGLVPSLALLLGVRILSGVGRAANEIVHPSLIADLYPEKSHPRAYLLHRLGNPLAQVSGVLAGFIAEEFGWTKAFYILTIPTVMLTIALSRMKDPGRRAHGANRTSGTEKVTLISAFRRLATIRSFPRLWGAAVFLGGASAGIFVLASLYFEKQFDFGPRGRGFVQFLIGTGWFLGVVVGGAVASRATMSGKYGPVVTLCAASFLLICVAAALMWIAPTAAIACGLVVCLAMGNGIWQSPFFSTVAKVAPASLSGQAFGISATFYAVGNFLTIAIAKVADSDTRVAFLLVSLFGLIAAACAFSVVSTIDHDVASAASPSPTS